MTNGLNTKNADIITLLTATNEKLDTIITLLGGAPPTPTATLDDLLAILETIHTDTTSMDGRLLTANFTLDDIHTDTTSMDGKLLAIRNILRDPSEEAIEDGTPSISWNVYRLRRAIATENLPSPEFYPMHLMLSSLLNVTNSLFAINNAHLGNISDAVYTSLANLGVQTGSDSQEYTGYLFNVQNWLGLISGSIGLPIEANNRDVIQLLAKIADRPESQVGGGLIPSEMCEDAYISDKMVLIPGIFEIWPSIIFAAFPDPPPAGITIATTLGLSITNIELENDSENWSGWWMYVASNDANFGLFAPVLDPADALTRYPSNTWIDISFYPLNLAVYVTNGASLRVYLCSGWEPTGGGGGPWAGGGGGGVGGDWTECVEILSYETVITQPGGSTATIQYIPMSLIGGVESTDRVLNAGGDAYFVSSAGAWVATDNWTGVTATLLSGTNARIWYQRANLSFEAYGLDTIGDTFTIPEDTIAAGIDSFGMGTATTFSVQICPSGITPP